MLKKAISDSKSLGRLKSDSARLFYTWLIPHLDVEGRYSADPDLIKGHIFPKVKSMKIEKIKRLLIELAEISLIILYRNNGEDFLQLNKFFNHQKIRKDREGETKISAPNDVNSEVIQGYSGVTQEFARTSKVKGSKVKVKESLSKDIVLQIITHLNEKAKTNYSPKTKITTEYINGRIADGFKLDDFLYVIDVKCEDWLGDSKMEKFLRPKTLFATSNFEGYLNQKRGRKNNHGVGGRSDNEKVMARFERQRLAGDFDNLDDKEKI